jgi:arylsulfatase A-like enzyme
MTTNGAMNADRDGTGPVRAGQLIGSHDVLLMTLDTLRYDVAEAALEAGQTPNFARLLPGGRWERRHSPATFTYAAHHAFFAGFLPTPASPGTHSRLFAARFAGSATTTEATCVLDAPDIVTGLAARGYRTICIGGVGFFNKQTPLGSVLPGLFADSHWDESLGVASPASTERQVALAVERIAALPDERRVFLFVNVSAIHQPNRLFLPGATGDCMESMAAALAYVDAHVARLFDALTRRAPLLAVVCADHGTAYGEEGYRGHRLAHPVVWDVPYAELVRAKGTTVNGEGVRPTSAPREHPTKSGAP